MLKGEVEPNEDLVSVARREFAEETGTIPPTGPLIDLGDIRQKSGKVVRAWAIEGNLDPRSAVSNSFEMEWPPHLGRLEEFPEIDRVAWFDLPAGSRDDQGGAGSVSRSTLRSTRTSLS